jgi:hypothetical protein
MNTEIVLMSSIKYYFEMQWSPSKQFSSAVLFSNAEALPEVTLGKLFRTTIIIF